MFAEKAVLTQQKPRGALHNLEENRKGLTRCVSGPSSGPHWRTKWKKKAFTSLPVGEVWPER